MHILSSDGPASLPRLHRAPFSGPVLGYVDHNAGCAPVDREDRVEGDCIPGLFTPVKALSELGQSTENEEKGGPLQASGLHLNSCLGYTDIIGGSALYHLV